jgi:hypothetical protein
LTAIWLGGAFFRNLAFRVVLLCMSEYIEKVNSRTVMGTLGCVLLVARMAAGVALASPTDGVAGANPYSVISERNVFHLMPIPPPAPPEKPKVDLPVVKLSGFVTVAQHTRALFSMTSKEKKEMQYFNLAEGEKQDILEVVKIRADQGEVDIVNSGTPVTLTLRDDTLQPPAATPAQTDTNNHPMYRHGMPPMPGMGMRGNPAAAQFQPPSNPRDSGNARPGFPFPTRQMRGQP